MTARQAGATTSGPDDAPATLGDLVALRRELLALAERAAPRAVPLTMSERNGLRERWAEVLCSHCGRAHYGACPRLAETIIETRPGHVTTTVRYWPNDQWAPPAESFSVNDVWGDEAPPSQQKGASDGQGQTASGT